MSRSHQQVNFRLSLSLKEALEASAEVNKRSLTAEINSRLEHSFLQSQAPTPNAFSETLIRLRSQLGITQNELADLSGVSLPQLSRYERGKSVPRTSALYKLAPVLNVDVAELERSLEETTGLAGNEDEPMQAGQQHAGLNEAGPPILLALDKKLNALCKHLGLDVSQLGDL